MEIKTLLVIVHLIGLILGLGAATVADILFARALMRNRISTEQFHLLEQVTNLVVIGLGILIASGVAFVILDPSLYQNHKMWSKVAVVLVLTLNGLAMHEWVLPLFAKHLDQPFFSAENIRKYKAWFFASGAVSFNSWYFAVVLGAWKVPQFPYSMQVILGVFAIIITGAVLASPILAKVVSMMAQRKSKNVKTEVVTSDL